MTALRLDLGCGSWCRGDVGVTLASHASVVDATVGCDPVLERYGWVHDPEAEVIYADVEDAGAWFEERFRGSRVLLSHALEHMRRPRDLLAFLARPLRAAAAASGRLLLLPGGTSGGQAAGSACRLPGQC